MFLNILRISASNVLKMFLNILDYYGIGLLKLIKITCVSLHSYKPTGSTSIRFLGIGRYPGRQERNRIINLKRFKKSRETKYFQDFVQYPK